MSTDTVNLKTVALAALVAAVVSAAGLGLFIANQSRAPETKVEAKLPAAAKQAGETAFNDTQKASIEQMVRDYLVRNPEILIEMSGELERRQAKTQKETQEKAISQNADDIFRAANALVAGNPKGDVTVVEFFDYNCGFCKRAFPNLLKLIDSDPNVRVVLKEFPIFGEGSASAARVAIAAKNQGKYMELHTEMLKTRGQVTQASALRAAEKLGLDIEKLKKDMESAEVRAEISETRALAEKLGIQGTPFYLVGDRTIPGAPNNLYELFQKHVAEIRKDGCAVAC
ncbi:MAG: DsbA family protein [Hyphomicrobiales bacterium]|nr:DsbA family protein [Hyphomicrobiales bacterium]